LFSGHVQHTSPTSKHEVIYITRWSAYSARVSLEGFFNKKNWWWYIPIKIILHCMFFFKTYHTLDFITSWAQAHNLRAMCCFSSFSTSLSLSHAVSFPCPYVNDIWSSSQRATKFYISDEENQNNWANK
jgi:hypothetical protein